MGRENIIKKDSGANSNLAVQGASKGVNNKLKLFDRLDRLDRNGDINESMEIGQ